MFFHYNNIIIAFYGVKKCGILKMTVLDLYRHQKCQKGSPLIHLWGGIFDEIY
tara:strand:- start:458 stop:616 length:159 start_codon:yes stop_codon:yes gene_type:complete